MICVKGKPWKESMTSGLRLFTRTLPQVLRSTPTQSPVCDKHALPHNGWSFWNVSETLSPDIAVLYLNSNYFLTMVSHIAHHTYTIFRNVTSGNTFFCIRLSDFHILSFFLHGIPEYPPSYGNVHV